MGTLRLSMLILAWLAASTVSSDAFADVKVYHGAFCTSDVSDELAFSALGAECVNGGCLFECPLMRDNINAEDNIHVAYVEFYNSPAPPGASNTISCSLCTQVEDDESSDTFDCQNGVTAATTGLVQLTFDDISTFDGNESSYFLDCLLQSGDILVQVHVDEQN